MAFGMGHGAWGQGSKVQSSGFRVTGYELRDAGFAVQGSVVSISVLARPSVRPRPRTRTRPRRRCTSFDFEDDDEDDWSTLRRVGHRARRIRNIVHYRYGRHGGRPFSISM
jgi:hypothetical protein